MKVRALRAFLASLILFAAALVASGASMAATPRVLAIEFDNDVNPVTADYVIGKLHRAEREGYDAAVILLDTPGGLSESMRKIVKAELAAKVPVVVYVSPNGARAASAGVWIGQAADILAMAPQTNIGSSTPINVGGEDIQKDLRNKVVNDAAASLKSLAENHGRNVDWAVRAVKEASNISAREALRIGVIDAVATSLPALLRQIDGRKTVPRGLVLHTAGAEIDTTSMSTWKRILDTLIDSSIVQLLLSVGLLGIVVELWHPGLIFPGAVGGISLVVSLYGLQVLPVSWAGILLMVLAAGFWAAEPFVMSHGALALAGGVCFVIGSLMLFDPAGPAYDVSLPVTIAIAAVITLFLLFAVAKVTALRRRPATTGDHALTGAVGVVRSGGLVSVRGELWQARPTDGQPLRPDERVRVESVERGLVLVVSRAPSPAPPGREPLPHA